MAALKPTAAGACEKILRDLALAYPGTEEASPWGHTVVKVRKKSFIFMGGAEGTFSLSVKLPFSAESALSLPFASPTEYGLGKSGWVTATFTRSEKAPLELLRQWMDESYRAIAPKKLLAELDGPAADATGKTKRSSPKKTRRGVP